MIDRPSCYLMSASVLPWPVCEAGYNQHGSRRPHRVDPLPIEAWDALHLEPIEVRTPKLEFIGVGDCDAVERCHFGDRSRVQVAHVGIFPTTIAVALGGGLGSRRPFLQLNHCKAASRPSTMTLPISQVPGRDHHGSRRPPERRLLRFIG